MQRRSEADPRVVEYYEQIGVCVADSGLTFDGFGPTAARLAAELDQLEPGAEGLVRLGELQQEELALARAVVECGGGPDATRDAIGPVFAEYERQFLVEYGAELKQYQSSGS